MSCDILAAFLPKLLHRVPEHANAMGRHIRNEDAGVARRPSAYALFCSDVSRTGVSERPTHRLNRKTPVKSAAAMQHKWQLGNMFMIIVLHLQYFGFRSFFLLPPKVLMRQSRPDIRQRFHALSQEGFAANRAARKVYQDGARKESASSAVQRSAADAQPEDEPCLPGFEFRLTMGEKLVIESRVGFGTYCSVHKVAFLSQHLALKIPRKHTSEIRVDGSPRALRDIARENEILHHLGSHPCILKSYGVVVSSTGISALLLELATCSLDVWIRNVHDPSSLHRSVVVAAWDKLAQLLHGLFWLHGKGILHGDLKCSNILCFEGARVALADFGLAKALVNDRVVTHGDELYSLQYRCVECLHAQRRKA